MAIAVNNYQEVNAQNSSATTLSSYAVGSESRRRLVVVVATNESGADRTVSSVVFNTSESLTQDIARVDNNDGIRARTEIWSLDDPSNATANIVATFSASSDGTSIQAFYLTDCKAQAAEATGSAEDLSTPFLVAITSVTNGAMIVYGGQFESFDSDITVLTASGLTSDGDIETETSFNVFTGMGHEVDVTAGSESGGWTHNGGGPTVAGTLVAAAFEEDLGVAATALSNPGICIAIG